METDLLSLNQIFDVDKSEPKLSSFSSKLWNFSWSDHFPLQLPQSKERVETTNFETVSNFYRQYSDQIFEENDRPSPFSVAQKGDLVQAKARYYQEVGDFFAFKKGDEIIGVLVATPVDWSSYYIRSASLLPQYQGGKRYQTFLIHILQILQKFGVQRLEFDTSPSNLSVIHIHNKFNFNITGMILSERWGSVLRYTKFLNPNQESIFLNQFCHGVRPQTVQN